MSENSESRELVRIPYNDRASVREGLRQVAEAEDVSVNKVIKLAVKAYLEQHNK